MIHLENNQRSEEEKRRAIEEHLKETERVRIENEELSKVSTKEMWRKRTSKWKSALPKVLSGIMTRQLQ